MTDAMKPLGLSMWQLTTPRPMTVAGGRLFVDVTRCSARRPAAPPTSSSSARSDPLLLDAAGEPRRARRLHPAAPRRRARRAAASRRERADRGRSGDRHRADRAERGLARRPARARSRRNHGPELVEFILEDLRELRRILFDPRSHQVFMPAMDATWWLNEHLEDWLGEKNAADTLTQSVPHNVTSEMGLALLDVADAIRPYADVVAFLEQVDDDGFLDELTEGRRRTAGGRRDPRLPRQVRDALRRRGRHHAAALERAPDHARAADPRQHPELRARRRRAALREGRREAPSRGARAARAAAHAARRRAQGRGRSG